MLQEELVWLQSGSVLWDLNSNLPPGSSSTATGTGFYPTAIERTIRSNTNIWPGTVFKLRQLEVRGLGTAMPNGAEALAVPTGTKKVIEINREEQIIKFLIKQEVLVRKAIGIYNICGQRGGDS